MPNVGVHPQTADSEASWRLSGATTGAAQEGSVRSTPAERAAFGTLHSNAELSGT